MKPDASSLVRATVWISGEPPREADLSELPSSSDVLWFDVTEQAHPGILFELLHPYCQGLEQEMIDDLLSPDELPEGKRWHGGTVRLASSFAVYPPDVLDADGPKPNHLSPHAVYQPVELLAGDGWLITRWHDACHYCGSREVGSGLARISNDEVFAGASKRWLEAGGGSAGDLGVMVMHGLAFTYAPAHRRFYAALEEWELRLYGVEQNRKDAAEAGDAELGDLWGARARLRDWLNQLNVPGLRSDLDRAWLPATDHKAVIAVDERVDKALQDLLHLGETLRSSFHLLHIQKAEEQRERNEELQRRVEMLATGFLIPTLIVGFYGANTWVPGEQRHWGFWVMVAIMVAFTTMGMVVLWLAHRRRNAARAKAKRSSLHT